MRTTRKAKTMLNRMLENRQVTPEGLSWLTVSTDPFHDTEVSCSGYPDISTSRSLVQTFTKTISVEKPSSVLTGTWDCHTFFNPLSPSVITDPNTQTGAFYSTDVNGYGQITAQRNTAGDPRIFSGVNAVAVPTGQTLFSGVGESVSTLQPPINTSSGPYRLIAVGYEVVNTTAEIYKQGSVTVYKTPAGKNQTTIRSAAGPREQVSTLTDVRNGPAITQTEAALYPNSRTWEAKEGAYIIPTMNSPAEFLQPVENREAGLLIQKGIPNVRTGIYWLPYINTTTGTPTPGSNEPLPFDVSGAIFTGLNLQSTLQVTVRYIIERVPTVREPDLLVLTRPPCPYDPMVLEIYTRAMNQLPVGCMVKDNPLGEWFSDILGAIGDVAPIVGRVVGNFVPGANMIGQAVGSAAKAGQQVVRRANVPKSPQAPAKKKNPPQKQNPPGTGKRAQKKKKGQ